MWNSSQRAPDEHRVHAYGVGNSHWLRLLFDRPAATDVRGTFVSEPMLAEVRARAEGNPAYSKWRSLASQLQQAEQAVAAIKTRLDDVRTRRADAVEDTSPGLAERLVRLDEETKGIIVELRTAEGKTDVLRGPAGSARKAAEAAIKEIANKALTSINQQLQRRRDEGAAFLADQAGDTLDAIHAAGLASFYITDGRSALLAQATSALLNLGPA